jgi:hypothetical protein
MPYVLSTTGRDPMAPLPNGVTLKATSGNVIAPDGSRVIAVDASGAFAVCSVATPECRPALGIRDDEHVAGWSRPLQAALSGLLAMSAAPDGTFAYRYRRSSAQLYVIKGVQ